MKSGFCMLAIVAAASALLAVSCDKELSEAEIGQQETIGNSDMPGIYVSGESVFSASASGGEVYVNPSEMTSRIQEDDAVRYVDIMLSEQPVEGGSVNVTCYQSGIDDLSQYCGRTYKNVSVLKIEGDMVYLWNRKPALGFVILWY
ncbi:MAG: hypothetical protein LKK19_01585 [Bacteroidales bacterium]|jgi:hypothetical protein|nr:hypothetical protein [Bacteroidales bacterium]MCI2121378.1 hypothetical protein [Bacteroidales bacterium]MCI2145503.1 hypothetical protein [Bacteroidales bacterium]